MAATGVPLSARKGATKRWICSGVPTWYTGTKAIRGPAIEMTKSGLCDAHSSMRMAASTPLLAAPPNGTGISPLRNPASTALANAGRARSARRAGSGSFRTASARSRRFASANCRATAFNCSCCGDSENDTVTGTSPAEADFRAQGRSRGATRVCSIRAHRLSMLCSSRRASDLGRSAAELAAEGPAERCRAVEPHRRSDLGDRRSRSGVGEQRGGVFEPSAADHRGERLATCADGRVQRAGRDAEPAAEAPDVQRRIGQPLLDLALYLGPQRRPPVDADGVTLRQSQRTARRPARARRRTSPPSGLIRRAATSTTSPRPRPRLRPRSANSLPVWRRTASRQPPRISWGRR